MGHRHRCMGPLSVIWNRTCELYKQHMAIRCGTAWCICESAWEEWEEQADGIKKRSFTKILENTYCKGDEVVLDNQAAADCATNAPYHEVCDVDVRQPLAQELHSKSLMPRWVPGHREERQARTPLEAQDIR